MAARRPTLLLAALTVVALSFGAGATASRALLIDQESSASTLGSGTWASTSATVAIAGWDIRDSSSGTESNVTDPYAYADGIIDSPKGWTTAFSSTIYLAWDYNAPMPAGQALSGANFLFRFIPNVGAETGCFYFEVRRASTDALLGTHGSTSSPVACHTGSTYTTFSTSLPEVSSSDIANDLRIKLFAKESNAKPLKIDLATVSATTSAGTWTLFESSFNDQVEFNTTTPWKLHAADGTFFLPSNNLPTTFASNKYVTFTFDPFVPGTASVSAASLTIVYQSATSGATSCFYYEVYSAGGSLLATHGSSSAPESCHAGSSSWTTYTASLPEVDSPANANGVKVKMFVKNSGSNRPRVDQSELTLTYSY